MIWNYPDTKHAVARFAAGGESVVDVALEQRDQSWYVSFTVQGPPNDVAYSALRIFDGVFEAVQQFLAIREPQTILFTTTRDDLAEAYGFYLQEKSKRFALLGYRVDGQHRVLRRFKPARWPALLQAS